MKNDLNSMGVGALTFKVFRYCYIACSKVDRLGWICSIGAMVEEYHYF